MAENDYTQLQDADKWTKRFKSGFETVKENAKKATKVAAKGFVSVGLVLACGAMAPSDAHAKGSFSDLFDKGYDVGRVVEDVGELFGSEETEKRGQEIQDRNYDRQRTVDDVKDLGRSFKKLFGR